MGNECCGQKQAPLIEDGTSKKPSYLDDRGVPVPNAYKRYVKPPTTVGRQSIVMRNLHDNNQVPEWMWLTQNQNILDSGSKQYYVPSHQPLQRPFANNRHTYEPIQGRFQGVQTVNLSKLQNKPLTRSYNAKPRMYLNEDPLNTRSVQPKPSANYSGFRNIGSENLINHQEVVNSQRQIVSFEDVPTVTSVNLSKSANKFQMKMTESKTVMSPFDAITRENNNINQSSSGSAMNRNNAVQINSGFNSNIPSVNNSIQRKIYY